MKRALAFLAASAVAAACADGTLPPPREATDPSNPHATETPPADVPTYGALPVPPSANSTADMGGGMQHGGMKHDMGGMKHDEATPPAPPSTSSAPASPAPLAPQAPPRGGRP